MASPQMDRNPSPPPHRDGETGEDDDAIGGTVYSKHWLFSTLTRLIQMVTKQDLDQTESLTDLSDELEEELCKVWDMAMDEEICVGILGNMACFTDTCLLISQNDGLGDVLLLLLGDSDPPTLLETCRLLLTCVSQPNVAPLWLQRIQQQTATCANLCFIMSSSTNVELLIKVGELVDKLFDEDEELMKSWLSTTPSEGDQDKDLHHDVASALLEAAVQLRKESPKALEAYLHALQLLTTVDEGLQNLISDGGCGVSVWKVVCEVVYEDLCQPDDPPLILQEQKALLAPALALLFALYTNLRTDISSALVASLLRILSFHSENQQERYKESGEGPAGETTDDGKDAQLQVLVEIVVELLSTLLSDLPMEVVPELLKIDHLTEKIWVSAFRTLLAQHNKSVLCFINTLTKVEPKLADIIKKECSITSESNEPKPRTT
ncbi:protein saal1 isoform 2-T2 [Clarias gariepinus]